MSNSLVNESTIVADMLNISFHIEEVSDEYRLNLPTLTLNTYDKLISKLNKFPKSEVINTLLESINVYMELKDKLGKYTDDN